MNKVWELFFGREWLIFSKGVASRTDGRKVDQQSRAEKCRVSEKVWNSAIYLGPGGPLMRDRQLAPIPMSAKSGGCVKTPSF
ncbi:hypothetical protein DFP92_1337 [Yoonia sediminilitoris]|uniref:Uncharacterized protein n=1 Tax=Yoonia sediminilitoris TaxID=1286148 RepID=A0A2T6K1D0_9RHOB|nr:hypothetical protein C8N45_1337 [Yoonia sediminilitoris]RCW89453.1 hypothetical protein DFP92_1337 [Yoonia sediminilitoris]